MQQNSTRFLTDIIESRFEHFSQPTHSYVRQGVTAEMLKASLHNPQEPC